MESRRYRITCEEFENDRLVSSMMHEDHVVDEDDYYALGTILDKAFNWSRDRVWVSSMHHCPVLEAILRLNDHVMVEATLLNELASAMLKHKHGVPLAECIKLEIDWKKLEQEPKKKS